MAAPQLHSVESARARMLEAVEALGSEPVMLHLAADRTLAASVVAARDQPPFRSSAMDGYAVRAADLALGQLTVVGQSAAGTAYGGAVGAGEAVRIFTGAAVPPGADLVVPQERVRRDDVRIFIDPSNTPARNIREAGIDFTAGLPLIDAGTRLHARHIALLASAGSATLSVSRVPRIALLATGSEIAAPGQPVGPYQIYDSVTFGIGAMIERWGGCPVRRAPSPDDDEAVSSAIDEAIGLSDLVVIVGGASVGDYDIVKRALASCGLRIAVPKVAVRPGQPTWFGTIKNKPILGLPGNPAAAFVCAYLFLRPLLDAFLARSHSFRCIPARFDGRIDKSGEFERYWRASVRIGEDARLVVRAFENQDSSLVSVFASANALIRRLARTDAPMAGDLVEILLLDCT